MTPAAAAPAAAGYQYVHSQHRWHRVWVDQGARFSTERCNLDQATLGACQPVPGPGLRCAWCHPAFATAVPTPRRSRRPSRKTAGTLGGGGLALATLLLLAPKAGPVPSPSGSPGPSATAAAPTLAAPTGAPTQLPSPSVGPTAAPEPTQVPVPTLGPSPTSSTEPPAPTPAPTPAPCVHPGHHLGVDPCRWPHQPTSAPEGTP